MAYKCKICGGAISLDQMAGIAICDYCGTKQALPLFTDDSERLLYESGNNYLLHSEYDKAENVFNQLLTIKPHEAELYWDLVLCKYGVTYVKDPKSGKYVPTCNRTHYTPIFSDKNYQKAIELSSGEKRVLFEEDAKNIDNIQKGIIAVSKMEKPFDIFISYKETDINGNRTEDSIVAQDLYERLTSEGYKVFFSRITLEDKVGTQYEPYIYAALSSSKVMLTISSTQDNIEAPWVKNEWSRYLTLRQQDSNKTLIPLYFSMDKNALPEEFALLSAQDMKKEGFEQELIRGIKKLIPLPVLLVQKRIQLLKSFGIVAAILGAIVLAVMAIVLPDYLKEKRYVQAQQLFAQAEYEDALAAFSELEDYKDSKKMTYRCTIQPDYDVAVQLFHSGNYVEAARAFEKLVDYEDSAIMKEKSEAAHLENVKAQEYNDAMQLYYNGNYAGAAWAFKKLDGFKDAAYMRDKAEKMWREKLATVVTANVLGSKSYGSYYISANGSVESFSYDFGTANEGIDINAHGKIVSLGDNYELCALYEDGYVSNSAKANNLEEDWEDVIQISPVFNSTNVVLKSDGTIAYGSLQNQYNEKDTDTWLEPVNTWKDIVSLSWDLYRFGYGGLMYAALAGVDINGKVYVVTYGVDSFGAQAQMETEYLCSLTNISQLSLFISEPIDTTNRLHVNFAALDKDNNLITYIEGKAETQQNPNYSCVQIGCLYGDGFDKEIGLFAVNNKGELRFGNSNKLIMEDVVHITKDYIITRSGSIYYSYCSELRKPKSTEAKTHVKDVWLEGNE